MHNTIVTELQTTITKLQFLCWNAFLGDVPFSVASDIYRNDDATVMTGEISALSNRTGHITSKYIMMPIVKASSKSSCLSTTKYRISHILFLQCHN